MGIQLVKADIYFIELKFYNDCSVLGFSLQTPLVYNFGETSPGESVKLHNALVTQLANSVFKHFDQNPKSKCLPLFAPLFLLVHFISLK